MAIDTQEKRTAYLGIVTPNSNKDEEWRREILGLYPFEESGEGEGPAGEFVAPSSSDMRLGLKVGM